MSFELLTTSMVDPRGRCLWHRFPALHLDGCLRRGRNRTKVTDPLGNHTDYIYNAPDQPTSVRDERATGRRSAKTLAGGQFLVK